MDPTKCIKVNRAITISEESFSEISVSDGFGADLNTTFKDKTTKNELLSTRIEDKLANLKLLNSVKIGTRKETSDIEIPKSKNDLNLEIIVRSLAGQSFQVTRSFEHKYESHASGLICPVLEYQEHSQSDWQSSAIKNFHLGERHQDFGVILKPGARIRVSSLNCEFVLPEKNQDYNPFESKQSNSEATKSFSNNLKSYLSNPLSTIRIGWLAIKTLGAIQPSINSKGEVVAKVTPRAVSHLFNDPYESESIQEGGFGGFANKYRALFESLKTVHRESTGSELATIDCDSLRQSGVLIETPYINDQGISGKPYMLDHHRIKAAIASGLNILVNISREKTFS